MKTLALALAILFPSLASADSTMLAFKGGIGVDPVAGVTSTGTPARSTTMPGGSVCCWPGLPGEGVAGTCRSGRSCTRS